MSGIVVSNLCKSFRIRVPGHGIGGAMRSLIRPQYKSVEAVRGLSFTVERGERVAFIGPNGAGKSTTIKMLSGILYPTSGEISILGYTPWKNRRQMAYKIGTVFGQRSQLWYHLPAGDTFDLLASAYAIDRDDYKKRLAYLEDIFQLGPLLARPVRQLSLGERMRCEIAASLLHRPEVLFLDEPTVGLDVTAKTAIRDLIRDASEQDGTTILLTSHDTGDMEKVCDRVIVIDHGALVIDQPVRSLRSSYISRKIVMLHLEKETIALDPAGLTILRQEPHHLVLSVETEKRSVESVIQQAMHQSGLSDLSVEDPPMEDIIKTIYRSSAAGP